MSVHEDCPAKTECAFAPRWDRCTSCRGPILSIDEVSVLRNNEVLAHAQKLRRIKELVEQKVLSHELCPEPKYWRWAILKPDELPAEFAEFLSLGEVRF